MCIDMVNSYYEELDEYLLNRNKGEIEKYQNQTHIMMYHMKMKVCMEDHSVIQACAGMVKAPSNNTQDNSEIFSSEEIDFDN